MHIEHEFALCSFANFVGRTLADRNSDGIWWPKVLASLVAYAPGSKILRHLTVLSGLRAVPVKGCTVTASMREMPSRFLFRYGLIINLSITMKRPGPMKRIDMINIKTNLRLRQNLKLSRDEIAAASGVLATGTMRGIPGGLPRFFQLRRSCCACPVVAALR